MSVYANTFPSNRLPCGWTSWGDPSQELHIISIHSRSYFPRMWGLAFVTLESFSIFLWSHVGIPLKDLGKIVGISYSNFGRYLGN